MVMMDDDDDCDEGVDGDDDDDGDDELSSVVACRSELAANMPALFDRRFNV